MAYVLQDEDQNQQQMQGDAPAQPQGGQSATLGTSPGGGAPAGGQQGQRSFANISSYLAQNKPQASKLADKVGGYVTGKVEGANQALEQGQQVFNQGLQDNKVEFNQNLVNQFGQDPTKVGQDQQAQLRKQLSGQYQGPQGLDQDVFNKGNDATNTAKLTESESGRKQLLSNVQNKNRATAGVSSLNNLLLQNDPEAKAKTEALRGSAGDLDSRLQSAGQNAAQQAAAAKAKAAEAGQKTQQAFTGEQGFVNQFKQNLDQRTQAAKTQAQERTAAAEKLIKGGDNLKNLTPEQKAQALQDLGLSEEEYNKVSTGYNENVAKSFKLGKDFDVNQQEYVDYVNRGKAAGKWRNNGFLGQINKDAIASYEDYNNRQNKWGTYADVLGVGSKDLSNLSTVEGLGTDDNMVRQKVATKDDLAKLQAYNSLLGIDDQYIQDNSNLGTFNADLVNFDRIKAGLK